ncbi:hypothetical protein [Roseateles sp.]|uniref:hypothetical protein n=1 Tax=Roseateles sp. TaxID=1971397 RepID=UPI0025D64BC8|nr:hypothetical protein [Roseateles sp.]MBV8037286.1 hypothetical protein [Roseateles sp.]
MDTSQTASADDIATVRQLYAEAQQWSRHYEQLLVSANTLIISAALIFVGLAMNEHLTAGQSRGLLIIPLLTAVIGAALTVMLVRLWTKCVERMIRLEGILGCHDEARGQRLDGLGALLPPELRRLPVRWPISGRFFLGLQAALALAYLGLMCIR